LARVVRSRTTAYDGDRRARRDADTMTNTSHGDRSENISRIGVLGTGIVGQTLARRLVEVGYDVMVGARSRGR
jgi:lactate dehydrogenase-like 2-hydroxyacid dehydrogenase